MGKSNFFKIFSRKFLGGWLLQFPHVWKLFFKIYGNRSFDVENLVYSRCDSKSDDSIFQKDKFEIIFDAQCLQTPTKNRGIGRYALTFINAICLAAPNKQFAAYLTTICTEEELIHAKNLLSNLGCPNLRILVINPFQDKNDISVKDARNNLSEFLKNLRPGVVITLSPFEKIESAIPILPNNSFKTAGILYDLIPLQFSSELLISKYQTQAYLWQLENMKSLHYLIAISETSKSIWQELVSPVTQILVIKGGVFLETNEPLSNFSFRTGVLCVGSEQSHKNLENLVIAYSLLDSRLRGVHPLTIIGVRAFGARSRLRRVAKKRGCEIVLPEYLSDSELRVFYSSNRVYVMPSFVEGLSLPILEAWKNGLPVVGSAHSVAQELIQDISLLFDPSDPTSINSKILLLLSDEAKWSKSLIQSKLRLQDFNWESSCIRTFESIVELSTIE
jgi:glycosyltransferase involved in cell wall biosynthesis